MKHAKSQEQLQFTHLDKLIFPKSNITKKSVINYYAKITPFLLPLVKNHLIVMQRFPQGIEQEGFYQKQISDYFPTWIKTKKILLKKGDHQTLLLLNTQQDLMYLANQNVITFHSWLSSIQHIQKPDKIVFDLDPDNNSLTELHTVAKTLKKILIAHHLTPFIMTTGSRGYHIVVPIKPKHSFEKIHNFAKEIAQLAAEQHRKFCTADLAQTKRKNKIFIDYLRNSYGQTSVAPYSLRAHEGATVATPIDWDELSKTPPQKYTMKNIFLRLARKKNSWKKIYQQAKDVVLSKSKR